MTVLLLLLLALPAAAELKVSVGADGVKVITNESGVERQRRLGTSRVPVPDPSLLPLIEREADRHGLDPELVQAVIQAESGYNVRALSSKGAMGLMQLMPATAVVLAVDDPYAPDENVRGGTAYLKQLFDRFGRLELALAAYNAGPGAVERYGGVPPYPETREYVRRVIRFYKGEGARADLDVPTLDGRGETPRWERRPDGRLRMTTGGGR